MLKDHFDPTNKLLYGEVKEPDSSKFLGNPSQLYLDVLVYSQAGEHFKLQAMQDVLNFLAAIS